MYSTEHSTSHAYHARCDGLWRDDRLTSDAWASDYLSPPPDARWSLYENITNYPPSSVALLPVHSRYLPRSAHLIFTEPAVLQIFSLVVRTQTQTHTRSLITLINHKNHAPGSHRSTTWRRSRREKRRKKRGRPLLVANVYPRTLIHLQGFGIPGIPSPAAYFMGS